MKGKKIDGICQIVRLRQFVKKWHMISRSHNASSGRVLCSLSVKSNHCSPISDDSDDEDCCTNRAWPPPDVPEGYLAVYVGRERRRFIIPTGYLSRPVFRTLLDQAEEEFGFDHQGGLTIPCEVSVNQVLRVLERNNPAWQNLSLDELLNFYPMERECGSQNLTTPASLSFSNMAAVQ